MRLMPNTKLTEQQFKDIILHRKLYYGSEAIICDTNNYGTLYKLFSKHNEPQAMGDNKEKKVVELYQRKLKYSARPISTISVNDMIVGYEMTTDYDYDAYKLYQLSIDEIIQILKKSREVLEYFLSEGIIYVDVAPRNILFNRDNGEIMFCDMDNTKINDCSVDKLPFSLIEYDDMRGIDSNASAYAHNYMTLQTFELDTYIATSSVLKAIFTKPAKKIIKTMRNPKQFNGEYLVDYLKKCK